MMDPKQANEIESLKEAVRTLDAKMDSLGGLKAADAGLKDRLGKYGIQEGDVVSEDLIVSTKETVNLNHATQSKYTHHYKLIEPRSIDQLKSWLGVSDSVAGTLSRVSSVPLKSLSNLKMNPIISTESLQEVEAMMPIPDRRANLKSLSKAYLYGNSSMFGPWKPQLDASVNNIVIAVVLFRDIVIGNDATLIIDRDTDILHCNRLIIHKNATLIGKGNLKIDCASIQGNVS